MDQQRRDIVLGALLAAFFLVFLFVVIPAGIAIPAGVQGMALSPAFWPRIITVLMIALGVGLLVRAIAAARLVRTPPPADPAADGEDVRLPPGVVRARIAAAVAILFAYYLLIEPIGMTATSILAFAGLAALFGERRWVLIAGVGAVLAVVLTLFFTDVAYVPMPTGTWWE